MKRPSSSSSSNRSKRCKTRSRPDSTNSTTCKRTRGSRSWRTIRRSRRCWKRRAEGSHERRLRIRTDVLYAGVPGFCQGESDMRAIRLLFIASGLMSLAFGSLGVVRGEDAKTHTPKPTKASKEQVCKLLKEARDLYIADGSGEKANPHGLMYVWQREHISHSPLLHVAMGLVENDD